MSANLALFRAEWDRIGSNRVWSMFLIWIFPVGAAIMGGLGLIALLLSDEFLAEQSALGVYTWDEALLASWEVVNNIVGRWIIISFAAWVFASEYKHGTWKNLTTRRGRVTLILNKFITLGVYVTVAFTTMSLIFFFGNWAAAGIVGTDYGLSTAGDVFGDFARDYALNVFLTLSGTFVSAAFAAAAAMVTKNVFASVIVGILFYMLEFLGMLALIGLINLIFGVNLARVYQFLPSYNLEQINAWVQFGEPNNFTIGGEMLIAPDVGVSVAIVFAWAVGLVVATALLFRRQDITT